MVVEELSTTVASLCRERDVLASLLRDSADGLEKLSDVNASNIQTLLTDYCHSFGSLLEQVGLPNTASLAELQQQVASLETLEPARKVIEPLNSLSQMDGTTSPAIDAVRQEISTYLTRMTSPAGPEELDDARAILNGEHKLAVLARLLTAADSLDDTAWGRHVERVREAFGTEFVTAFLRGKLKTNVRQETNRIASSLSPQESVSE